MQSSGQDPKGEDETSVNHFNRSNPPSRMPLFDFLRRKRPSVHDTLSVVGLRSALLLGMLSNMGDSETDEGKEDVEGENNANMSEILEENEADVEAAIKDDKSEIKEEVKEDKEALIESAKPTTPSSTPSSSSVMSPSTGIQDSRPSKTLNHNPARCTSLNRDVLSTTSSEESSAPRNNPKFRKGSDSETERDRPIPTVTINNRRESRDGKDIQENGGIVSQTKPTFAETMFGRNAPKIRAKDLMNIPVTVPSVRATNPNQTTVTSTANGQTSTENLSSSSPSIMTSTTTNTSTSDEFSASNSSASAKRVSFLKTQSMEETRYKEFTEAARTLREEEYSSDGPKQHSRRSTTSSPGGVMKKITLKKQQQNKMAERQRSQPHPFVQMSHPQFSNHNHGQRLPLGSGQVVHVHWNQPQPWMTPAPNQNFLTVPQPNFFQPYFDRGFNNMPGNHASNPPSFPNFYQMQYSRRQTSSTKMKRQNSVDYTAQSIPEEDWASNSPNGAGGDLSPAHHDDRRMSRSSSRSSKRSSMPIRKSMSLRLPPKSPPSPRSSSSQSPSPPPPPVSSEILSTNRRRAGNQTLNDSSSSTSSGSVKTAVKVSVGRRHEVSVEVNATETDQNYSDNDAIRLEQKRDDDSTSVETTISPKMTKSNATFRSSSPSSILLPTRCNDEDKIVPFASRKMAYKVTKL